MCVRESVRESDRGRALLQQKQSSYPKQHKQPDSISSKLIKDILQMRMRETLSLLLVRGRRTSGSTPLNFDFDIFSQETLISSSLNCFDSISSGLRYRPLSFSRYVFPCTMPLIRKRRHNRQYFMSMFVPV